MILFDRGMLFLSVLYNLVIIKISTRRIALSLNHSLSCTTTTIFVILYVAKNLRDRPVLDQVPTQKATTGCTRSYFGDMGHFWLLYAMVAIAISVLTAFTEYS